MIIEKNTLNGKLRIQETFHNQWISTSNVEFLVEFLTNRYHANLLDSRSQLTTWNHLCLSNHIKEIISNDLNLRELNGLNTPLRKQIEANDHITSTIALRHQVLSLDCIWRLTIKWEANFLFMWLNYPSKFTLPQKLLDFAD